ncbi:MAG: aminoacyl-tRNA hydrolase [Candidatus Moraniibacteriota bacterium]|nr:MAG: aminoacyl-tRNA hydrolase [Candidatus Moranbacteria bacterium]
MKYIIGLGNPGERYQNTRHNIGAAFTKRLRAQWGFPEFRDSSRFLADVSIGEKHREKILMALPTTFMNLSGDCVRAILRFYRGSLKDLIIVHDELDLPLGTFRASFDSRSAGHHGVESIIDALGSKAFLRYRIGIGPKTVEGQTKPDASELVLNSFLSEERALVESCFLPSNPLSKSSSPQSILSKPPLK